MDEYDTVKIERDPQDDVTKKGVILIVLSICVAIIIEWPHLVLWNGNVPTSEFESVVTDPLDSCVIPVEKAIEDLTCDIWKHNYMNTTACILMLNAFVPADMLPITFAHEGCLVLYDYMGANCGIFRTEKPYLTDPIDARALGNDICSNDLSGYKEHYDTSCTDQYEDPFSNQTCCSQYAAHVIGRFKKTIMRPWIYSAIIGQESSDHLFCPSQIPLLSFLDENPFSSFLCNYYKTVLFPFGEKPIHEMIFDTLQGRHGSNQDYLRLNCDHRVQPVQHDDDQPEKMIQDISRQEQIFQYVTASFSSLVIMYQIMTDYVRASGSIVSSSLKFYLNELGSFF